MGSYKFIAPSNIESPPAANEYLEYRTIDEDVVSNTESQDTFYNPLTLKEINSSLHSLIQNDFYSPLLEVIHTKESQQFLENAYRLEVFNNLGVYLGDQEEYIARVSNILKKLNISLPLEFASVLQSNYYEDDYSLPYNFGNTLYLRNEWIRHFVHSSYVTRKWFSSYYGYKYILSSMYRNGSICLRSSYEEPLSFTVFTNRYFKVTEFFGKTSIQQANSFYKLLPSSMNSLWPMSVGTKGLIDYSQLATGVYSSYDSSRVYDENYNNASVIRYDQSITSSLSGRGLLIDIALDSVMTHLNSINTNSCLLDNMYLEYISKILPNVKKVTESFLIGSELNLVASNSGRYIDEPASQVLVVDVGGTPTNFYYTHPNIQAKFQVFKTNWDANPTVTHISLGSGSYDDGVSNVLADHTDNPLTVTIPTDVDNPILGTTVEEYDEHTLSSYHVVSSIIYKNEFIKETLASQPFNIARTDEPEGTCLSTIIDFPHTFISEGTASFVIEIPLTLDGEDKTRKIKIDEVYNNTLDTYYTIYSILDEMGQVVTVSNLDKPEDLMGDITYSNDTDYFPSTENDVLILREVETIDGMPVYCKIDHRNGTLELIIQVNPNSVFNEKVNTYNGTGNAVVNGSIECSYIINSGRGKIKSSKDTISSYVRVSEVGLFNSDDDMVAYGVFPPVIYDSNKYYLNVNCLLEMPTP